MASTGQISRSSSVQGLKVLRRNTLSRREAIPLLRQTPREIRTRRQNRYAITYSACGNCVFYSDYSDMGMEPILLSISFTQVRMNFPFAMSAPSSPYWGIQDYPKVLVRNPSYTRSILLTVVADLYLYSYSYLHFVVWDGRVPEQEVVKPLIAIRDKTEHTRRRRPWTRAFSTNALKGYEIQITKRANQLVDALAAQKSAANLSLWISYFAYVPFSFRSVWFLGTIFF